MEERDKFRKMCARKKYKIIVLIDLSLLLSYMLKMRVMFSAF